MRPTIEIAFEWARRCFGDGHVFNPKVRALRCAEEVIELSQAVGITKDDLLKLVQTVYSRPVGHWHQELGGVLLTAYILAVSQHADPDQVFMAELHRVLAKPPEHFAQRNKEKNDLGFTGLDLLQIRP